MENLLELLSSLTWQDWATTAGIGFGLITLLAYLDQKRSAKNQGDILEFVKRNLDKDISEEAINELKNQRKEMQEQINKHLPQLARSAVLKEQAQAHAQAVSHHYLEWSKVIKELKESPSEGRIDHHIERIIIDKLVPKHERQMELDTVRNKITALSVSLALLSNILFYPINALVSILISIPLASNLLHFIRLQSPTEKTIRTIHISIFSAYLLIIGSGIFLDVFLFLNRESITKFGEVIIYPLLAILVLSILFSRKVYLLSNKYVNHWLKGKYA